MKEHITTLPIPLGEAYIEYNQLYGYLLGKWGSEKLVAERFPIFVHQLFEINQQMEKQQKNESTL